MCQRAWPAGDRRCQTRVLRPWFLPSRQLQPSLLRHVEGQTRQQFEALHADTRVSGSRPPGLRENKSVLFQASRFLVLRSRSAGKRTEESISRCNDDDQ